MAAAKRVKGQDVAVSVLVDGDLQTRIDTVKSCTVTLDLEKLQEQYLGEKADRYDSIFHGIDVEMEGHVNSVAYFELADAIVAKAQRRSGSPVRIDVAVTLDAPNGDLITIAIIDISFEEIPIDISSRSDFVGFKLSGSASEYKRI